MIRAQRISTAVFILLFLTVTSACNSANTRITSGEQLAQANDFQRVVYDTTLFNIVSFQRVSSSSNTVTVFIEGDGLAWKNRRRVSANPTPQNPVALKLALTDPSRNIIYLARPCQFLNIENERNCEPQYWTSRRAAREVVQSYHAVLNEISDDRQERKIRLVGYSGGASIATILAAERQDIIDLRTVAGNLDIEAFTNHHQVTPLHGSINPVDMAEQLVSVPQLHLYSMDDKVIVPAVIQSYVAQLKAYDSELRCLTIKPVNGVTHQTGWEQRWQDLSKLETKCKP